MDKTSIIAVVFCVLAYFGWAQYMKGKYPPRQPTTVVTPAAPAPTDSSDRAASSPTVSSASAAASQAETHYEPLSPEALTIETEVAVYRFNQHLGGIDSIVLKNYQNDEADGPMELIARPPLLLHGLSAETQAGALRGFHGKREDGRISLSRNDGMWEIAQTITPDPHTFGATVRMTWKNTSDRPQELTSIALLGSTVPYKQKSSSFLPGTPTGRPTIIREVEGETSWQDIQDYCEGGKEAKSPVLGLMQEVDFLGFDQHYFIEVLIPQHKKTSYRATAIAQVPGVSCSVAELLSLKQGSLRPGDEVAMEFKGWFGPKSSDLAAAYDQRLANSLDFGFFAAIARPLLWALKAVYALVLNWGLAIIIFTIFLKMLFYPLTRQAAVAQQKMKKLQPDINAIKERYKDDPRRQQQEMMRFMSVHKANPLKGCLPILPQIPVFFAFFRVLSSSIELRHAPFFGWIADLSVQDPYFITPLLLGLCMFLQQKLSPAPGMDKTQEKIMLMLPLMFTAMMLTLPAGLVLYMLTNTIISIGQQQWLNRRLVSLA